MELKELEEKMSKLEMEVNEGDNNEAVSVKEIFLKYFLKIFLRGLSKKYKEMNWSLSMNHYSEWKNLSTGYLYLKYIGTNEDNQRTTRKWYWKTSKNKTCSGKLLHTLIRGVFRDLKFFFSFSVKSISPKHGEIEKSLYLPYIYGEFFIRVFKKNYKSNKIK